MSLFDVTRSAVFGKDDEAGLGNPDPTMKKGPGSPKGTNMPPAGGESMAPADSKHPPGSTQKQAGDAADEEPAA